MRGYSIQQCLGIAEEYEQVLKVTVRKAFLQLPSLILPVASRVQHVMLVFDAVAPSVFETGMSGPASHQDMLVRYMKKWFHLQEKQFANDLPLRMQISLQRI